jgi:ribosome-binding factor A
LSTTKRPTLHAPFHSSSVQTGMRKQSQRAHRVGDQLQRELADLLKNEVKDPRVGPVTITGVDVSADLSHATVRFTHLAGRETAGEVAKALVRTAGFLRSELSRRLNLYSVPQLAFEYDDSIETGMRMSRLIDEAIAEDRQHPKD